MNPPHRALPLVPLALAVLLASFGTSSANVALPDLAAFFGVSFGSVQWIVLAYLLAMTASLVTAGRLGDVVGRRRLFLAGLAVSAAASALCAASPDFAMLVAARFLQGIGAALLMAMAFALVGDAVPATRRGAAMGLLGAMSALGTTLGPAIGGFALAGPGWRLLFLLPLPMAVLATAFTRAIPSSPVTHRSASALDWPGAALLAAALASYAVSLTPGQAGLPGGRLTSAGLLGAAAALAAGFLLRQARTAAPLIRLAAFRDPIMSAGMAASALVSTVMMATLVTGPFYLGLALHLAPGAQGLVLAIGPVISVLAGVPAGQLADRIGAAPLARYGLVLLTGGTAWLSLVTAEMGVWGYTLPIALLSAGYAAFQSPNTAAVMARASAADRGAVSGLLNLARNLGLLTGASLMGAVFAAGVGNPTVLDASPAMVAAGMRLCFRIASLLAALALLASLADILRTRARGHPFS